jgi:F-type H+-transporting ATPase subunit alpha
LKQPQWETLAVPEQLVSLLAVSSGLCDSLSIETIGEAERAAQAAVRHVLPSVCEAIAAGERLSDEDRASMENVMRTALAELTTAPVEAE